MNTLVCKNCGSSSFYEEIEAYVCQHCGTKIVKPSRSTGNKRFKVIAVVSVLILLVAVMVYIKISSVEKQLDQNMPILSKRVVKENLMLPYTKEKLEIDDKDSALEQILKVYAQKDDPKAFFISLNKDGAYTYGYAFAQKSIQEATQKAFASCEEERKKRRLKSICTPYLINDRISPTLVQ